jgi:hypothetical protein
MSLGIRSLGIEFVGGGLTPERAAAVTRRALAMLPDSLDALSGPPPGRLPAVRVTIQPGLRSWSADEPLAREIADGIARTLLGGGPHGSG